MKKLLCFLFVIGIVLSVSSSVYADDKVFTIMLREWFPGIESGGVTEGALASGNIFDDSNGKNVGWVNISWSHDGIGIEECNADTELISIRIVMNFYVGGRIVLAGPTDGPVYADWDFDDPEHPDGNIILIGYSNFLDPDTDVAEFRPCSITGDTGAAYIAQILSFPVERQRFGSYGLYGKSFSAADVYGFLDHRPFVSPAVVGKVILHK